MDMDNGEDINIDMGWDDADQEEGITCMICSEIRPLQSMTCCAGIMCGECLFRLRDSRTRANNLCPFCRSPLRFSVLLEKWCRRCFFLFENPVANNMCVGCRELRPLTPPSPPQYVPDAPDSPIWIPPDQDDDDEDNPRRDTLGQSILNQFDLTNDLVVNLRPVEELVIAQGNRYTGWIADLHYLWIYRFDDSGYWLPRESLTHNLTRSYSRGDPDFRDDESGLRFDFLNFRVCFVHNGHNCTGELRRIHRDLLPLISIYGIQGVMIPIQPALSRT